MDTFGSVWDAADEVADDQSLRALTSARMQVAPVWPFLAASTSDEDFTNRLALSEDRIQAAASAHGVQVVTLAQSLVQDYRTLKAEAASGDGVVKGGKDGCSHDWDFRNHCKKCDAQMSFPKKEAAFYVEDGGDKVGGPYDSKADAQDAIDGKDVSGDDLKVVDGDSDGEDSDGDGDDEDTDGDDNDSDEDQDDDEGEPADKGNPFAKKESALDAAFPVISLTAAVVHQPGETVFVDHFMGHDEHEGRKGVWASVVASPGQHGHEDRADSHLLKPMAPGGTHFFHHFGGLGKTAGYDQEERYYHGSEGWKTGVGSYDEEQGEAAAKHYNWKPHRLYDSISSAVNHLSGGRFHGSPDPREHRDMVGGHTANQDSFNHCNSCDHVYSTYHPDHEKVGHKDVCPNCNDTDHHESLTDVLHDSGYYNHSSQPGDHDGAGEAHSEDNYGDPYGRHDNPRQSSRKTALPDGVDPLQWVVETIPSGEGEAEREAHHDTTVRTATLVSLYADVLSKSE